MEEIFTLIEIIPGFNKCPGPYRYKHDHNQDKNQDDMPDYSTMSKSFKSARQTYSPFSILSR